ncbi:DUF4214 domain-containing protein [Salipiger bermudensis]|uniref:DUF4214 domain-containing protein n=1 Tax=Salipiger bermudensis TaxID=344736 RepID=UPI001A8E1FBE|nr:DUF4214 domain-containing protein [Salipiger bermudensis]MBN9678450.1 DUF4214 domain-containing protein [Salipiger bermudensis]
MLITLSGDSYGFFDNAFYNLDTDDFDVDLVSASSSRVVVENPSTGAVTAFVGSGLVASSNDDDIRGTLSALEFYDADGDLVASMTGINWELRALIAALDDALTDGDDDALMALIGRNGEVTVDATAATGRTDLYLDNLDVPITFIGGGADDEVATGDGSDLIETGDGDDYIDPGDNDDEDTVDPGLGDDTIDAFSMDDGFLNIDHAEMVESGHGMRFDIDGNANTALITKTGGNGTTTIYDVMNAMEADGLALSGTASDDTFNATVSNDGWLALKGGQGDDSFVLGESFGTVRLDYKTDNSGNTPTRGIVIDMGTGIVSEDGFGGSDTITTAAPYVDEVTGELYFSGRIEIRGTAHADSMTGSARDERFITLGGNDTVSGGDGWDTLRFDRSGMTGAVAVDLEDGTAMGSWQGTDFRQTISGIEDLRGTREFGDKLSGSDASESFFGNGGDDAIFGDGFDPTYAMDEAASVYRLYQATLDRAPDLRGLTNWSERLFTGESGLQQVATGFVNSAEFQATYGALDDAGFVELLYQNVLGRAADAGGLANWTGQLADGTSRAEVVLGFSQSAEFTDTTAAEARAFANASSQAGWGDDVYRVYQATLDRAPDITGFSNWSGQLAEGRALDTVINGFVNSAEFQATYGALDDEGFVELLYQNVLGRAADAGGLDNWTGQLAEGTSRAEVVRGFSQSAEFVAATAEDFKDWMRGLEHDAGDPYHDWLSGETGDNALAGGLFADVFDFEQEDGGSHLVLDLEAWDYISLGGFDYGSASAALTHMSQSGSDVLFSDQGVEITFQNTRLADITDDMIMV